MLLTEKYKNQISSVITCYDRILIQGVIPTWSYADGMTGYFLANDIRIFDYASFSQTLTQKVRKNAEQIADENGLEIEFIRKIKAFRKSDYKEHGINPCFIKYLTLQNFCHFAQKFTGKCLICLLRHYKLMPRHL